MPEELRHVSSGYFLLKQKLQQMAIFSQCQSKYISRPVDFQIGLTEFMAMHDLQSKPRRCCNESNINWMEFFNVVFIQMSPPFGAKRNYCWQLMNRMPKCRQTGKDGKHKKRFWILPKKIFVVLISLKYFLIKLDIRFKVGHIYFILYKSWKMLTNFLILHPVFRW